MLMAWDGDKVEVLKAEPGAYTLSLQCRFTENQRLGMITGIYGPNKARRRKYLWGRLNDRKGLWDLPWLIGGDFNTIIYRDEKNGNSIITGIMGDFNEFSTEHNVLDLEIKGAEYTWSNRQPECVLCKLERFLICGEMDDILARLGAKAVARVTSDHIPPFCGHYDQNK